MALQKDAETGEWIVPDREKIFITQPELAALMGFSVSAIAKWMKKGLLPTTNVNGRRHIRRDLLYDWLDEQTDTGRLEKLTGVAHCPRCNEPTE